MLTRTNGIHPSLYLTKFALTLAEITTIDKGIQKEGMNCGYPTYSVTREIVGYAGLRNAARFVGEFYYSTKPHSEFSIKRCQLELGLLQAWMMEIDERLSPLHKKKPFVRKSITACLKAHNGKGKRFFGKRHKSVNFKSFITKIKDQLVLIEFFLEALPALPASQHGWTSEAITKAFPPSSKGWTRKAIEAACVYE